MKLALLAPAILTDQLSALPPGVNAFDSLQLVDFTIQDGGRVAEVRGALAQVELIPAVPLPAAGWLLLSGVAMLGAHARARVSSRQAG